MAHVAKYQASACGRMCEHYDRTPMLLRGFTRSNIDLERTQRNYNLAPERDGGQVAFISERIDSLNLKRKPRKDAVRMCDCVVTLPKTLDVDLEEGFFESAYAFLSERYGEQNVISAWVHKDEAQPHMHFAWVPVTGDGRLAAKDVVTRRDLQTLHRDMQQRLEADLGCAVEVILDPANQADKQLSALSQADYIAARQKIETLEGDIERLEGHRQSLQSSSETFAGSVRTLSKARGDAERESGLASNITGLREQIRASEGQIGELEHGIERKKGEIAELGERIETLEGDVRGLRDRFERLRGFTESVLNQLGYAARPLTDTAKAIAAKLGIPIEKSVPAPAPARTVASVAKIARERAAAARQELPQSERQRRPRGMSR